MPFNIGTTELILLLAIVFIVFGASRFSKLGGELGQGIRQFRRELQGDDPIEEEITHPLERQ